MTGRLSSKILKLAALKPLKNEPDTLVRNHDGTLISVKEAPFIRALAEGLGVTFNISIPEDGENGFKKPDGTWNGIIGMLVSGEADLSGNMFAMTKERRKAVFFTYPIHVTDFTFMTDKPKSNPKSFAVFDAFSFEVWVGIGLCVIMMSLLLYILLKKRETYSTILIETIGCLIEESFSFHARQRNTAMLLFFWFLGVAVLTYSYKAIILSFITVPKMVGIRDITDLSKAAKENSIMCMTYKGNAMWQIESNDDRLKSIGKCLKRGLKKSLNSHRAFFSYAHKKAFIIFRLDLIKFSKDYFISKDSFSLMSMAIAYSKSFCCPKKLDRVIHRIVAADLYPKMVRDRYFIAQLRRDKTKNYDYDSTRWKPLTLKDFTGAFLVLIIGHFFSLVIFVAEVFCKKYISLNLFTFSSVYLRLRRFSVM